MEGHTHPNLDSLFKPSSIAIVGASPEARYSNGLKKALEYGYEGDVYPVNPNRDEVWELTCYDDITEVPVVVDLVIVVVPREYVIDVVRDAGDMGVGSALVITAGFAEADERGAELEAELADVADEYGINVCGPNCIGISNMIDMTVLKAGSPPRKPTPGSIALVSQSGALAFTTFFERAADEDVGFAYIVSTGNEADLTTTDYLAYLGEQPEVDVICTYIEGVDDPREFVRVADTVTRNGTPVLSVKIGKTEFAEAATLSHTGSLVGNDDAWEAAFEQTGIERVDDIPELIGRASAHSSYGSPGGNRVCIASTSGGLTSLLADMAAENGIDLPDLTGETEQTLLDMDALLTFGELHNPIDIRGQGADVLPEIAEVVFADDSFDAYVFALGIPAVGDRGEEIADKILETAALTDKPVLFLWTGRKTPVDDRPKQPYERVREEMPLFYDPKRCIESLASLIHYDTWVDEHGERPTRASLEDDLSVSAEVSEYDSGVVLSWEETREILGQYGIDVVETKIATSASEAETYFDAIDGPVVMKIDSPDIPHRARADAVQVGVSNAIEARSSFETIIENSRSYASDAEINGVLIQPQIESEIELLVGMSRDEQFGPLITVGAGGTFVEHFDDSTIRIPPFSVADGIDAVEELRVHGLLEEVGPDAAEKNTEAVAELMNKVGELSLETPVVSEIDLNPVMVTSDGIVVVDTLLRT